MSEDTKYEKQPATTPPPYSVLYPTGDAPPQSAQYGFHPPAQPQPQYPPQAYPQQGYPQQPQPIYLPPTSQTTVVTQPTMVIMGGCPSCRVGVLEDGYTFCGILCAICFFPIGILCCLAMKEKQCTNCSAKF